MKDIANSTLADTLPHSIAADTKVKSAALAIDPHLTAVGREKILLLLYVHINQLPGDILNHLASQYNITPWRDHWDVGLKRASIIANIANKRKKGTLAAIEKAVQALGSGVSISLWYNQNPPGEPGTFNITATYFDGATSDVEAQEDVIKAIDDAKPYTRHYVLTMQNSIGGGINVYGCIRTASIAKLYNF